MSAQLEHFMADDLEPACGASSQAVTVLPEDVSCLDCRPLMWTCQDCGGTPCRGLCRSAVPGGQA